MYIRILRISSMAAVRFIDEYNTGPPLSWNASNQLAPIFTRSGDDDDIFFYFTILMKWWKDQDRFECNDWWECWLLNQMNHKTIKRWKKVSMPVMKDNGEKNSKKLLDIIMRQSKQKSYIWMRKKKFKLKLLTMSNDEMLVPNQYFKHW